MPPMDLSDIGYDAFLINGRRESRLASLKQHQTVRLRLINAAASTYFNVKLAGAPMTVIAADGADVQKISTSEILMGMAETYDVIVSIHENKDYELRATNQDSRGFASAWLGVDGAEKTYVADSSPISLYTPMNHSQMGHTQMNHTNIDHSSMDHSQMDHTQMNHSQMNHTDTTGNSTGTITVDQLKSLTKSTISSGQKLVELKMTLDGDMARYVWFINEKTITEDRTITISEGDIVRINIKNTTMMHHPMHLHGHFFRVLTAAQDYSPLKHTVDVPPHGERTIEFLANEPGIWMLHCHNLYHMKSGMARIVEYAGYPVAPEIKHMASHDPHSHEHIYNFASVAAFTSHAELQARASRTRDQVELRAETNKGDNDWQTNADVFYRRWQSNFFSVLGGATVFEHETRGLIGASYQLPFLVESQFFIDTKGKGRLDLAKSFQWTTHIRSDFELRARDSELTDWQTNLVYANSWNLSYGLNFSDRNIGAGLIYKF